MPRLLFTGRTPARLPGIVTGLPGSADHDYWPTYRELVVEIATDGVAEHGAAGRIRFVQCVSGAI